MPCPGCATARLKKPFVVHPVELDAGALDVDCVDLVEE